MQDDVINMLKLVQGTLASIIDKLSQPQPQQLYTNLPKSIWAPGVQYTIPNYDISQPAGYAKPSILEGVDQLASQKQSKFLFALSCQHNLSTQELNSILLQFGVQDGWTGSIKAKDVSECAATIKAIGTQHLPKEGKPNE